MVPVSFRSMSVTAHAIQNLANRHTNWLVMLLALHFLMQWAYVSNIIKHSYISQLVILNHPHKLSSYYFLVVSISITLRLIVYGMLVSLDRLNCCLCRYTSIWIWQWFKHWRFCTTSVSCTICFPGELLSSSYICCSFWSSVHHTDNALPAASMTVGFLVCSPGAWLSEPEDWVRGRCLGGRTLRQHLLWSASL
jgi:hypothetical protein